MRLHELTETSRPDLAREQAGVVVAASELDDQLLRCLQSLCAHTPSGVPIVLALSQTDCESAVRALLKGRSDCPACWLARAEAKPSSSAVSAHSPSDRLDALTASVNRVLSLLGPGDAVLLSEPCLVTAGWLERLRAAARADGNTASASALADVGTALALAARGLAAGELARFADAVAEHTMVLRPRLSVAVGPCVYLRREALELVGSLDAELELSWALEVDFAQRCLLAGLAHVAADDALVGTMRETDATGRELPARLRERYPYLSEPIQAAASPVLPRAIEAARGPRSRMWVTIDARALGATITGTQRHILELIRSLTDTGALRLRLLVGPDTSAGAIELLRSLQETEVLPIASIDDDTPRSTIFHRPQQVFETADLQLALRLGERIVLNQLDLIAYRNPGYHSDRTAWQRYRRVTRQALGAAERIVVFSNHTRLELLSDELATDERIRIVPPGLDHPPPGTEHRPAGLDGVPGGAGGEQDSRAFLLCLGTDFRHKNRLFALRMLASLRERHGWDGRLVLAGTHVPYGSSRELERDFLAAHPRLADAITELGAVEEEEKAWLMGRAAAVVYPSTYEGFGLVPLEAALSGVPCLFASQSSLADVLPGEVATIVPWDPDQSAARTLELLADPAARALHVKALLDVAQRLTWKESADATLEIYREATVAPVREAKALSEDELNREVQMRQLIAEHDAVVQRLVREQHVLADEREHARRMYDQLNAEVGFGLSLIGPHGTLPDDAQRALLALSNRPRLSRPLYGAAARAFRAARAASRAAERSRRSSG